MAGLSTVYDIKVGFSVKNRAASAGLGRFTKKARLASKAVGAIGIAAGVAMVAVSAGLAVAITRGIRFNAEMEQLAITMAGLMTLNKRGSMQENLAVSTTMMARFQKTAIKSTATTKDFAEFASRITGPLTRAGASMDDLAFISERATIAARAFGIETGMAALDIEQAMLGTLKNRDRFARALLEPMGITTTMWNKMVRETPLQAVEMLRKAFEQGGLQKMAEAQEKSWGGVVSTLEDNFQIMRARTLKPMFEMMKSSIKGINDFLIANQGRLGNLADAIGDSLGTAFRLGKRFVGFMAPSLKNLLMFADVARNMFHTIVNSVFNATIAVVTAARTIINGLVETFKLAINGLTSTFDIGLNLLKKAANFIPGVNFKTVSVEQSVKNAADTMDSGLSTTGLLTPAALKKLFRELAPNPNKYSKAFYTAGVKTADTDLSDKRSSPRAPGRQDVKVTINRIEVSTDDPDRFAFQMVNAMEDIVRNPAAARDTISEV